MAGNGGARSGGKGARKNAAPANANEGSENARSNGHAAAPGQVMIDLEFLRGLIEAVDGSDIDNVEIVRAGTRIRISKSPPAGPVVQAPSAPGGASAQVMSARGGATSVATAPAAAPEAPAAPPSRLQEVKS